MNRKWKALLIGAFVLAAALGVWRGLNRVAPTPARAPGGSAQSTPAAQASPTAISKSDLAWQYLQDTAVAGAGPVILFYAVMLGLAALQRSAVPKITGPATRLQYSWATRVGLAGMGVVWAGLFTGIGYWGLVSERSKPEDIWLYAGAMGLGWLGLAFCAAAPFIPSVRYTAQWISIRNLAGRTTTLTWREVAKVEQDEFKNIHVVRHVGPAIKLDGMLSGLDLLLAKAPVKTSQPTEQDLAELAAELETPAEAEELRRYIRKHAPYKQYGMMAAAALVIGFGGWLTWNNLDQTEVRSIVQESWLEEDVQRTGSSSSWFEGRRRTVEYLNVRSVDHGARPVWFEMGTKDPSNRTMLEQVKPGTHVTLGVPARIWQGGTDRSVPGTTLVVHRVGAVSDSLVTRDWFRGPFAMVLGVLVAFWAYHDLRKVRAKQAALAALEAKGK